MRRRTTPAAIGASQKFMAREAPCQKANMFKKSLKSSSALACVAATLAAVLAAPMAAQAGPLIGLYTFEGAGGNFANVVDSSGNGNNPNFFESRTVSVTTGGQGYQGEAVRFSPSSWLHSPDGNTSGGGFTVPIDIKPSAGDLTIGGWLKLTPTAATQVYPLYSFFSHDDGCWDRGLWLNQNAGGWQTTGKPNCGGPTNTGATMSLNEWHLVVVSMAGTNASLYIDGEFKSTTVSASTGSTAAHLRIGAFDRSASTEPWDGLMDNVFVFRSALTANDISTIHRNGVNGVLSVAGLATNNVPEPGSLALVGLALTGLWGARRRASPGRA
jgi:hypothetical protein